MASAFPRHPLAKDAAPSRMHRVVSFVWGVFAIVFLAPVKLVMIFGALSLATVAAWLINRGTDPERPLPRTRARFFRAGNWILARLLCVGHGLFIVQKNREFRDPKAQVLCGNHCSYLDAMVLSALGGGSAVVNAGMADFWFLRQILKVSRAIVVQRAPRPDDPESLKRRRAKTAAEFGLGERSASEQMRHRVEDKTQTDSEESWPPLLIFPEGTISSKKCVLRFRTSAFRLGCLVQPFVQRYRTVVDLEWLTNSGKSAFLRSLLNPFGFIEVEWLPCVRASEGEDPRAFADRVGESVAAHLGAKYVKYTNDDVGYFMGWRPREACTAEYAHDFGALGTFADVRATLGVRKGYELV